MTRYINKPLMEDSIGLSVIIVNFNTYSFLEKCLSSIYQNSVDGFRLEVFVVDNASHDDSKTRIRNNFPKVRLIVNKKNIGPV